jgi:predicted MFS family arabinose efflux permease
MSDEAAPATQADEQPPSRPGTARPYLFFLAGVGSWTLAAGMQHVLFAWLLVGELRVSPRWVGVGQMCQTLPSLLFLLLGGLLADRVELRRLTTVLHLAGATAAATLGLVVYSGWLALTTLLPYALAWGTIQAFAGPARDAMISHVSGRDLMRAITGVTLVQFSASALGARLGGLGQEVGSDAALGVQCAILLVGLLAVARLPRADPHASSGGRPRALESIRAGLVEVRRSPRLFPMALLVAADGLFYMGPFQVLVPLIVRDSYGGGLSELSLVLMVLPIGTIVGSLVVLVRGGVQRKGLVFLLALLGIAALLLAIAAQPPFWVFLAVIFAWGIFHSLFFNTSRTLFQVDATPAQRARVLSVHSLGLLGMAPLSNLGAGLLAQAVGPLAGCALAGGAMLLVTGFALAATPVRRFE